MAIRPAANLVTYFLAGPYVARAAAEQRTAPLAKPKFYWGTGIENFRMAQTDPQKDGNRRFLDVYLQMQHYEDWKQDLNLLRDVGAICGLLRGCAAGSCGV